MIRSLALAAALSLAALPALSERNMTTYPELLQTMSSVICIGENACSMATTQKCSVALGKNIQFPEGRAGDHVLVTREGIRPILELDDVTVERINAVMADYGKTVGNEWRNPRLDPEFVKEWNMACGAMS